MSHTVLLVDDEASLLAGLARTLRKEPYRILTAVSAEKALETLGATHVDVVISDQDMPGMGGADLLAEVRRVYPDTVRFMLTGKATLELAVRAINDGAVSRFFVKPCNPVDLAATIRQALQHKDLWRKPGRCSRRSSDRTSYWTGSNGSPRALPACTRTNTAPYASKKPEPPNTNGCSRNSGPLQGRDSA